MKMMEHIKSEVKMCITFVTYTSGKLNLNGFDKGFERTQGQKAD